MFCDLVGSTELSVRLDPEDLREVIVAYQTYVAETVARFGGFVAKHMGDGMLVYFGYPRAHEHDAERAIQALPQLLPPEPEKRQALWEMVQEVVAAPGPPSAEGRRRLSYVETLFGVKGAKPSKEEAQHG